MNAWQHLGLSAFWFANQLHWGAMLTILIPSQAERLAEAAAGGPTKAVLNGWVMGIGSVVAALTPPLVGALSDRSLSPLGRRRPFVIGGTLINILGLFLLWLAFSSRSIPGYILAYLVIQLGNNIAVGAFSGVIPDVVPEAQRGTASGYMAALSQIGTVVGILGAGQMLRAGHQNDFLALTALACCLALFAAITVVSVREIPQREAKPFAWRDVLRSFWLDPRQHPDFGWVWLTRALFTAGWFLIQPILLYFLQDVVHVRDAAPTFSYLAGVVLLGATVTGLLGGMLSDRWGRKRIVFLAGMVMAAAALAFAATTFFHVATLTAVFVIGIFWGLGYGAYVSVDWALGTDVLPDKEDAGKDMGIWHLSMVVPQAVSPLLGGLILNQFAIGKDSYRPAGYALVFLCATVVLVLSATLIWRVKRGR